MTRSLLPFGDGVTLGTGTSRLEITPSIGVKLPEDCKMLLGVVPQIADVTPTTVQQISASLELQASSIQGLTPYRVLFPPVGAGLGATYNTFTGMQDWDINCRVNGGDTVHAWGTAQVANTVAPIAMGYLHITNDFADIGNVTHLQSEIGTFTAAGVIANQDSDTAGTLYSITGVERILKLFGLFHFKTIAAGDALLGQIKFDSTAFRDSWTHYCPLHSNSFGLGATGSMLIPGVSKRDVNIPIKPTANQVNIKDALRASLLPASAGSWISGVQYKPLGN